MRLYFKKNAMPGTECYKCERLDGMGAAMSVIARLERAGYEGYIVGGAVRDMLVGKTPHDYDIATNATPDQMRKVFPHSFTLNNAFGTVTIQVKMTHILLQRDKTVGEFTFYQGDLYVAVTIDLKTGASGAIVSCPVHMPMGSWVEGIDKSTKSPDPEGDRIEAMWAKKVSAPGYKLPYSDLTFEEKKRMLGPKKKKDWRGGGHAP